jgi:hypothetical protein
MKISRDTDGLRFVGDCEKGVFLAADIECMPCGKRVDPRIEGRDIALVCSGCGTKARIFWAESDLYVYINQHWSLLKQVCTGRNHKDGRTD